MSETLEGKPPTDEDLFYEEWGRETVKKNIETAQSVLSQLLTLNTALMGSSVLFMTREVLGRGYLAAALAMFFVGLVVSFLGIFPHSSEVRLECPTEIRRHKEGALAKAAKFMWAAGAFTGAGLIVVSIGAVCG